MPEVTIFLWSDSSDPESVGHISLQLPNNHYVSLWPDDEGFYTDPLCEHLVVRRIPGRGCLVTYDRDFSYTTYDSPTKYVLRDLDTDAMEAAFIRFKENPFAYDHLNGWRRPFFWKREDVKSCSGLVAKLLYIGGIDKSLPVWTRILKGASVGAASGLGLVGLSFFIKGIKKILASDSEADTSVVINRPSLDGDSTTMPGLAAASISVSFILAALLKSSLEPFSPNNPRMPANCIGTGAVLGSAAGYFRLTDFGPPFPIGDIGRTVRIAEAEEQRQRNLLGR